MVGIRRIKLLLGIIIPIFGFFLMSQNTSALWTADYGVRYYEWSSNQCSNEIYDENHTYNSVFYGCQVSAVVPISQETTATGDTVVYSGKFNLVKKINSQRTNQFYQNLHLAVRSLYFGSNSLSLSQQPTIQYWITDWERDGNSYQTLTVKWTVVAHNNSITNTTGRVRITFYADNNSGRFDSPGATNNSGPYYFENTNEPLTVYFIDTGGSSSDTIIDQNNISISQNERIINQNQTFYDNEYQGEQNISNQTVDDISDSSNQQTTNLIGVITEFLNALRGNGTSTSNCSLILPFPNFVGGSKTVNICTGKENLKYGNIQYSLIFSRLFLICFFVPLIWIILKLIYNEIRSWTNG